ILVNLAAFATIGIILLWRVVSLRRNPEPRPPQNLTPFLPDEELEGRKLERVLGIALLTTALIALTLFAYYVFEPSREANAEKQLHDIITYGRPGTPMPPWGIASGKGVLNEQGISDLVNYVESIQITPEKAKERFTKQLVDARAKNPGKSDGELLFQLQCARCHTKNWS